MNHTPKQAKCAQGCSDLQVMLMKDKKIISRVTCVDPPSDMPTVWNISSVVRKEKIDCLSALPVFSLCPACEDRHQEKEWVIFTDFLKKHKRVAVLELGFCEVYILPPSEESKLNLATVRYKGITKSTHPMKIYNKGETGAIELLSPCGPLAGEGAMSTSNLVEERTSPGQLSPEVIGDSCDLVAKTINKPGNRMVSSRFPDRNFVIAHPTYLKTLGQAHSSWIFGAIAELVDNSRDAKATKLEVAISMVYSKTAGKDVPMLGVIDNGHGMSHSGILRMVTFGHGQSEDYDADHIGRYGIGFKTGVMRLGKDTLVLTQTTNSRSIAFLSQSLNEGKDDLEIPIVSYRRIGQYMEVDTNVQSEDSAKFNLKMIKKFSPFDKYLIGQKAGVFSENGTGTQIYVWNLDEWGSSYSLEWENGMSKESSFYQGGIFIRSRRIRSRTGQISRRVPLDYSLQSYLEVIFLDPRMTIYVQGAMVNSLPLAKSLNKTIVENGIVLGKSIQLTLGRSQLEWEQANCGIFMYWHGRLIEAYKRVGSMVHSGDSGRGIIGVIDVTNLMDESNGHVWVHNNKQGFQDCEAYAELEKWLGEKADAYLDKYVDNIKVRKGDATYKPDHEWVQCDKCRKWRKVNSNFDSKTIPSEWFCYMKPFNGRCEMPEEKVKSGVITVSAKRHGELEYPDNASQCNLNLPESTPSKSEGGSGSGSGSDTVVRKQNKSSKRQRACPPRNCKKTSGIWSAVFDES